MGSDTKLLVLDAGHGGRDPGAVGNELQEKNVNLDLTKRIRDKLKENWKIRIILTREKDEFVSLVDRCNLANKENADLFYSVHCNGGGPDAVPGYEDYIHQSLPDNSRTADKRGIIHGYVYRECLKKWNINNRGRKKANFKVLRLTKMSAILTENLFITHPDDAELLKNKKFLDDLATAHAMGIATAMALPRKEKETDYLYIVQAGAFKKKSGAEQRKKAIQDAGFEAIIKQEKR